MSDRKGYRKVATIYARNGKNVKVKSASDNGRIYNALDKLESALRVVAKINRIIRGEDEKKAKKASKKAKKYAKTNKKTGMLVLKKAKYLKVEKPLKRAKK